MVVRVVAYGVGLYLVASSVAMAQTPAVAHAGFEPDADLVKWGITQGGLVLVTLVILWSYRKDFKTLLSEEHQKTEVLARLVAENSEAKAVHAETLRELVRVIDNLRNQK